MKLTNATLWQMALSASLIGLLAAGCSENDSTGAVDPPIPVVEPQKLSAHPERDASQRESNTLHIGPFDKSFEGIRFSIPTGWKEIPLSASQQGFIDARFQIPTRHGDVTLTCSSNAGGIESNIQRWIGQFRLADGKKPHVEPIEISGKSARWVDLEGEFSPGPTAGSVQTGSPVERMLGVAIPLGARDFYLKLTGNSAAVADIRAPFREFVREARLTD